MQEAQASAVVALVDMALAGRPDQAPDRPMAAQRRMASASR